MSSRVKPLTLHKKFKPKHIENRMKHEGDVKRARQFYFKSNCTNLSFLIKNRFEWMQRYIHESAKGLEVGAGHGLSKLFIQSEDYMISDFADFEWLDYKNIDALNTGFRDCMFDYIVSCNMLHHMPFPVLFLKEMHRILKPNGFLLIQDINASFSMRVLLRVMRHEGYSYDEDVFDEKVICTDPDDLWSANCAIPNLMFDNIDRFTSYFNRLFKVERVSFSEFTIFINSGGVVAKTIYLPLPEIALKILKKFDDMLCKIAPSIFALQRQIVLRKI